MPTFPDLREFFDPALLLTVNGIEYRIPAPNVNETLRIRQFFTNPEAKLSDEQHVVEILKLLGATLNEETGVVVGGVASKMIEDGVSWDELVHVGSTALVHYALSEEAALLFWQNGAEALTPPKEPAPASTPAPAKKTPARKAPAKRAAARTAPAKKAAAKAPAKRAAK